MMAKVVTPAEMAARLRIHPSAVRRLADRYEIGTKINERMRIYSADDVTKMQLHSTGVPGRPARLSDELIRAAAMADDRVDQAIKDGDPESAEVAQRLAGHMRRLAQTHEQLGGDRNPIQIINHE